MKDIQLPISEPTASVVEADHTEETTVTEVLVKQIPELEFKVEPELEYLKNHRFFNQNTCSFKRKPQAR